MIGRGAYGAPWLPGRVAAMLATGRDPGPPHAPSRRSIAREHYEAMLAHYGRELGLRNARKHIGWYLEASGLNPAACQGLARAPVPRGGPAERPSRACARFYARGR